MKLRGDRHLWAPYISETAAQLGLRDWVITLGEEQPNDPDHNAEVGFPYGQKRARIRLSDEFLELEPHRQRQIIIHELMHLHFHLLDSFENRRTIKRIEPCLEFGIDGIAEAIAPLFPLPNLPLNQGHHR